MCSSLPRKALLEPRIISLVIFEIIKMERFVFHVHLVILTIDMYFIKFSRTCEVFIDVKTAWLSKAAYWLHDNGIHIKIFIPLEVKPTFFSL